MGRNLLEVVSRNLESASQTRLSLQENRSREFQSLESNFIYFSSRFQAAVLDCTMWEHAYIAKITKSGFDGPRLDFRSFLDMEKRNFGNPFKIGDFI